ncbi:MAG: VCBS repeat-containing protein, partial [Candidatus Solibacter sp.]|nr:VCBS repeat-containing protein [Candidatus Solibacter sp.]
YQIETMPGGVAVLDYDNDGFEDIYFVNGAAIPSLVKSGKSYWNRLYHNNRDGTFTDVTAHAGVAAEGYSMAVAVGDYDNDGWDDLFVAGVNRNILYRNNGDGTFTDVTEKAGLIAAPPKPWSISAGWFDYDNDGRLDLFVVNYCKWAPVLRRAQARLPLLLPPEVLCRTSQHSLSQ